MTSLSWAWLRADVNALQLSVERMEKDRKVDVERIEKDRKADVERIESLRKADHAEVVALLSKKW